MAVSKAKNEKNEAEEGFFRLVTAEKNAFEQKKRKIWSECNNGIEFAFSQPKERD